MFIPIEMDEDDEKGKNELDWKEPETNKSDDADSTEIVTAPSLHPDELADTVVARVLDHLGVDHNVSPRWPEEQD